MLDIESSFQTSRAVLGTYLCEEVVRSVEVKLRSICEDLDCFAKFLVVRRRGVESS